MFELFKMLDACAHINSPINIENTILFVYESVKVSLYQSAVENIYDVYENNIYIETMTEKEILEKYKIVKDGQNF